MFSRLCKQGENFDSNPGLSGLLEEVPMHSQDDQSTNSLGRLYTYYSRLRAALGPRQVGDGIGQHPGADSRQCRRSARVVGVGIIDRSGSGECKSGEIWGSTSPIVHPTVISIRQQPFSVCSRHQERVDWGVSKCRHGDETSPQRGDACDVDSGRKPHFFPGTCFVK